MCIRHCIENVIKNVENKKKKKKSTKNTVSEKRMSERCTCFAHEIKCAYRLISDNENKFPSKYVINR